LYFDARRSHPVSHDPRVRSPGARRRLYFRKLRSPGAAGLCATALAHSWTPGYWAYGDAGYYWVPGVWIAPPRVGVLWTPGYWGFAGGLYGWHPGYWGPHVGFYGGVNYGFGYGGIGFFGGEWRGGAFAYNSAAANIGSVHVTNVYENRTVIEQNTIINNNHVSYNGGNGGISARPSPTEMQAEHEEHIQPTANQMQHESLAAKDRAQLAAVNHGAPGTVAASNVNSYHQVAQQHAQLQPISQADRESGSHYNPSVRAANPQQTAQGPRANANQPAATPQVHNERPAESAVPAAQQHPQTKPRGGNTNKEPHNEKHEAPARPERER